MKKHNFSYRPENPNFLGYKKNLPIWSLWGMKSKPDLMAAGAFNLVIWYLKRKKNFSFLFFLRSGRATHVQIHTHTHTHTHTPSSTSFSTWFRKCSFLHLVTLVTAPNVFPDSLSIFSVPTLCLKYPQVGNDTINPELLLTVRVVVGTNLLECWQFKNKKNSPSTISNHLFFNVQTAYKREKICNGLWIDIKRPPTWPNSLNANF